jgi:hypothetical protein
VGKPLKQSIERILPVARIVNNPTKRPKQPKPVGAWVVSALMGRKRACMNSIAAGSTFNRSPGYLSGARAELAVAAGAIPGVAE